MEAGIGIVFIKRRLITGYNVSSLKSEESCHIEGSGKLEYS